MISSSVSTYALSIISSQAANMTKIEEFEGYYYKVAGHVFAEDQDTILIKNFNYSGGGPDAYFWVGTQGTPADTDESSTAILAHPFEGKHFGYRDLGAQHLGEIVNQEIRLSLPPHLKVKDLHWLSVWCRDFSANFGESFFHHQEKANTTFTDEITLIGEMFNATEDVNVLTVITLNESTTEVITTTAAEIILEEVDIRRREGKGLKENVQSLTEDKTVLPEDKTIPTENKTYFPEDTMTTTAVQNEITNAGHAVYISNFILLVLLLI